MLVTDGANGLLISRLISRADLLARVASRVMALAVGSVSLLVAGICASRRPSDGAICVELRHSATGRICAPSRPPASQPPCHSAL
jgi:hypothetical protein